MEEVQRIVRCFTEAGARAKISSIHVNGWFGDYDKRSMTERLFRERCGVSLAEAEPAALFVGDAPNDGPMFSFFSRSVGVANLLRFRDRMNALPAWITRGEGGLGFAEMVEVLLNKRNRPPAAGPGGRVERAPLPS
jgi:3-deoxy-D-manno-octulosonate 8-phosphate phosphatase KdsC-like HAD superfamily phosphatase